MDVHDGQMACENMQSAAQKGDKTVNCGEME